MNEVQKTKRAMSKQRRREAEAAVRRSTQVAIEAPSPAPFRSASMMSSKELDKHMTARVRRPTLVKPSVTIAAAMRKKIRAQIWLPEARRSPTYTHRPTSARSQQGVVQLRICSKWIAFPNFTLDR